MGTSVANDILPFSSFTFLKIQVYAKKLYAL